MQNIANNWNVQGSILKTNKNLERKKKWTFLHKLNIEQSQVTTSKFKKNNNSDLVYLPELLPTDRFSKNKNIALTWFPCPAPDSHQSHWWNSRCQSDLCSTNTNHHVRWFSHDNKNHAYLWQGYCNGTQTMREQPRIKLLIDPDKSKQIAKQGWLNQTTWV